MVEWSSRISHLMTRPIPAACQRTRPAFGTGAAARGRLRQAAAPPALHHHKEVVAPTPCRHQVTKNAIARKRVRTRPVHRPLLLLRIVRSRATKYDQAVDRLTVSREGLQGQQMFSISSERNARALRLQGGCGIAAVLLSEHQAPKQNESAEEAMQDILGKMSHRGPDCSTIHRCEESTIVLGHVRLSINDATNGDQPFLHPTGGLALVANAEIYNFKEVLSKLPCPIQCRSTSDCEAILHAFRAWGIASLQELRGMFAFLIQHGDSLYAVRDPFGIKPLFYGTNAKGETWFASEVYPLSQHCDDIHSVPPGHYWRNGKLHQYYKQQWLPAPGACIQAQPADIAHRLREAVRVHLIADPDIKFGVFLSGGIDSSILAAILVEMQVPVRAFTVGMEDSRETDQAISVAQILGIPHTVLELTIEKALDALPNVATRLESYSPALCFDGIPQYLLYEEAAKYGVRVMFTGEGADEIFGGYSYFSQFRRAEELHECCAFLIDDLHQSQLLRVDRCSMAHGVEARVPFLDTDFLAYVMSLDPKNKLCSNFADTKRILREAFAYTPLPADVLWRAKLPAQDGYSPRWKQSIIEFCSREIRCLPPVDGISHPVSIYLYHQLAPNLGAAGMRALVRTKLNDIDQERFPHLHAVWANPSCNSDLRDPFSSQVVRCEISAETWLDHVHGLVLRITGIDIDIDMPLMEAGVDSLSAVELCNGMRDLASHAVLPITLMFELPTIRQLVEFLNPTPGTPESVCSDREGLHSSAEECIHGTSSLLPHDTDARTLQSCCSDLVSEVPCDRWEVLTAQPDLRAELRPRVRHGSFIRGLDLFDNGQFRTSPGEAGNMDPQQRLLLKQAQEALFCGSSQSDAGTGVFVAIQAAEYEALIATLTTSATVYASTGGATAVASGRLSFVWGFHGPCVSYNTACSAGLVAAHAASCALALQETAAALVAAVNLMLVPNASMYHAIAGMTSPSGRCFTFDFRADGYARGESCGAVLTRTVDDALGGHRGSAVRQDGRSASLTAPNGQAQLGLLRAALHTAATMAAEIACFEAHGTGTALGDPIEAGSLAEVVVRSRDAGGESLTLGSSKANAGHSEPAAGTTGILRLASQLQLKTAVCNAQLRVRNKHIQSIPHFHPCIQAVQIMSLHLNAGGVSSFGYSGTIAHVALHLCNRADKDNTAAAPQIQLLSQRNHIFLWQEQLHPFLQSRLPSSASKPGNSFRSYNIQRVSEVVAGHILQGQVVFPGAGYLEMLRGASSGKSTRGVYFLKPLLCSASDIMHIDCIVEDERFDVQSSEDGVSIEVNCSGRLASNDGWRHIRYEWSRSHVPLEVVDVSALYSSFFANGMHYGPQYRTLIQLHNGQSNVLARLQARSIFLGTKVHPADLDDAICASLAGLHGTRVTFSVGSSTLDGGKYSQLWAVRVPRLKPIRALNYPTLE